FNVRQSVVSGSRCYLILAQNSISEQFGILVADTPLLSDVPIAQIRALPESYRRADTLEIASHVTILPQSDASLTVFVLDVDRLVPPINASC
ncbi:MAG: chemotaxis protein CheW, partial [Microcystaceae cyanobacterium]